VALELTILVGTQTGTAELVAQELELRLDDGDTRVHTRLMDDLDASVFDGGGLFLICTSTFGQGDVPDNAQQLYESLRDARPDLSNVHYGVFGLGDRTYADTFRRQALRPAPGRAGCEPRGRDNAARRQHRHPAGG
jgi:MioC protein